jgi:hypothetical protein
MLQIVVTRDKAATIYDETRYATVNALSLRCIVLYGYDRACVAQCIHCYTHLITEPIALSLYVYCSTLPYVLRAASSAVKHPGGHASLTAANNLLESINGSRFTCLYHGIDQM